MEAIEIDGKEEVENNGGEEVLSIKVNWCWTRIFHLNVKLTLIYKSSTQFTWSEKYQTLINKSNKKNTTSKEILVLINFFASNSLAVKELALKFWRTR